MDLGEKGDEDIDDGRDQGKDGGCTAKEGKNQNYENNRAIALHDSFIFKGQISR